MPVGGGPLSGPPGGVTLTLQVDVSGTAFGGSPTWTDITGWWMSSSVDPGGGPVTIPWGRQDQSSVVESSSTSFTLNNADGRFTPGRSTLVTGGANPYYPNVRRHVRMRLTCTDGTTTVTLVDGLVDAWVVTPQTDGPTLATAELTDVFGRVSASTALRAMVVEEMLLDSPTALYPLDETEGSTSAGDLTGTHTAATVGTSKYGAGALVFGSASSVIGQTALSLSSPDTGSTTVSARASYLAIPNTLPATGPWTISFLFQGTSRAVAHDEWLYELPAGAGGGLAPGQVFLELMSNGWLVWHIFGGSASIGAHGTTNVMDGGLHIISLTLSADGKTGTAYIDGVQDSQVVNGINIQWANPGTQQILGVDADGTQVYSPVTGAFSDFATYAATLSTARMGAYLTAAKLAFAGESTATRWARLATYRPNLGVTSSGTVGTIGSRDLTGMSLGDAFTDTATAEGGVIETHRGTLRLIGRSGTRNPTTTVTLNAANSEVDIPTTWRDDTQGFVNDVTVTRADGAAQRATSAASIAADGTSQTSIDANVNSDRDAADMAGWTVAVGTQDELTSPTLTTNLNAKKNAALTLAVCALRTFDIVTLTNLPASAPAASMSLQAQGGQITVGADTFTATINTSAVPPTTLRADATADTYTKLDNGLIFGW